MARAIDANRMKEELLWGNVFLSAKEINALVDLIDNQPTLTPPNEPLTLDELREMDEPVWCSCKPIEGGNGYWCLCKHGCIVTPSGNSYDVGEIPHWVFYRRPPEGDEDT